MKIRYDRQVDAAYIYLKERPAQVTTVRLTEDVAVDLQELGWRVYPDNG